MGTSNTPKNTPHGRQSNSPTIEQYVSSDFLRALSESSEGFTIRPDYNLPAHRTGYTDLERRAIFYNPLLLSGNPELGIEPWKAEDVQGFCFHEVGHHVKEVLAYDKRLRQELTEMTIPETYTSDQKNAQEFLLTLRSSLQNAVIDIWLESYLSRSPHFLIHNSIKTFQSNKGDIDSYLSLSLPEQFLQFCLRTRYFGDNNYSGKLAPEVTSAYEKVKTSKAIDCLMDTSAFVGFFVTPAEKLKSIERKVSAYKEIFLPLYIELMHIEVERRKEVQEKQNQLAQSIVANNGESEKPASLTQAEINKIIEELLEELQNSIENNQVLAPGPEDEQAKLELHANIHKASLVASATTKDENPSQFSKQQSENKPEGQLALEQLAQMIFAQSLQQKQRGLAETLKVRAESVEKWNETIKQRQAEINELAAGLAEVFLEDRRWKTKFLTREGNIIAGLEFETIGALLSGEIDPATKQINVRSPEFLELEIEWIVDTSGSMSDKIDESVALLVVVTEALKKVHQLVADEGLLEPQELPFKVGVTTYSTEPERVTDLNTPLTIEKQITMVDKCSHIGGGTSETGTIAEVYSKMQVGTPNVIKMIIMLTDGEGDREGVWPIMRTISSDDQVILLVAALKTSDEGQAALDSYLSGLTRHDQDSNINVLAFQDVKKLIPAAIEFIARQVTLRKNNLNS